MGDGLDLGLGAEDGIGVELLVGTRSQVIFLVEEMRHPRRGAEVVGIFNPAFHESSRELVRHIGQIDPHAA